MTAKQRQRKIARLHRIRIELSVEARNDGFSSADRMLLARAVDTLRVAIDAMEVA